jgi:hypothetical protein
MQKHSVFEGSIEDSIKVIIRSNRVTLKAAKNLSLTENSENQRVAANVACERR